MATFLAASSRASRTDSSRLLRIAETPIKKRKSGEGAVFQNPGTSKTGFTFDVPAASETAVRGGDEDPAPGENPAQAEKKKTTVM
jgi:hypothetical protein